MIPNHVKSIVFLLGLGILSAGCSARLRKNDLEGAPRPATETRSMSYLTEKMALRENALQELTSLQAKLQLVSNTEDMKIAASGTLIWKRDSLVWLNVKKFGFEALRVLITPDSIQLLNRLEKSYTKQSLENLRQQFNLPETNTFDALQNLILGLPIQLADGTPTTSISEEKHRIRIEYPQFWADYSIEEGSFHLKNQLFLLKKDNSMVALQLDRYQKVDAFPLALPLSRTIETKSPNTGAQTTQIELESLQLNSNPSYKFEIPEHYSRK